MATARTATERADADRQMLRAADAAVHAAETALADARALGNQCRGELAEATGGALLTWNAYDVARHSIYGRIALLRTMADDFPRVEATLVSNLETARTTYAGLLGEVAL